GEGSEYPELIRDLLLLDVFGGPPEGYSVAFTGGFSWHAAARYPCKTVGNPIKSWKNRRRARTTGCGASRSSVGRCGEGHESPGLTLNQRVVGSSPTRGTPLFRSQRIAFAPNSF